VPKYSDLLQVPEPGLFRIPAPGAGIFQARPPLGYAYVWESLSVWLGSAAAPQTIDIGIQGAGVPVYFYSHGFGASVNSQSADYGKIITQSDEWDLVYNSSAGAVHIVLFGFLVPYAFNDPAN